MGSSLKKILSVLRSKSKNDTELGQSFEKLIKVFKKSRLKNTPIALVKVGKSKTATKAILTHTGSLSGKENIYDS